MKCNNYNIDVCNRADTFAYYFYEKIETIKQNTILNDNVYNGKNKLIVVDRFFMKESDVLHCLNSQVFQGFDQITL
jgi:hypothetical protein